MDNEDDQRLVGEGGGRDPWHSWGNKLPSSGDRILLQQGVKDLKHFFTYVKVAVIGYSHQYEVVLGEGITGGLVFILAAAASIAFLPTLVNSITKQVDL